MSPAWVPWQLPVVAGLLTPVLLLATGRVRQLPRLFVAMTVIAAENVVIAALAEHGPNLRQAAWLVPVNIGLWLWAVAPWLERRVLQQAMLATGCELLGIWAALAADEMGLLAAAMPVQAMILASVGAAVLVNAECRPSPGCKAVGTFLVFYFGVTALVWPLAVTASATELFWLFTMRALVHTIAYGRLAWELAVEPQAKEVTA